MRRARIAGVVLSVVLVVGPGLAGVSLRAQQPRQAWVRVADLTGAPITGLSADAFTIVEDGVKCRTLKAEPIEWPIKLTVMVDNGGKSSDCRKGTGGTDTPARRMYRHGFVISAGRSGG